MEKIDSYDELQAAILALESKQKEDFTNLKKEFIDIGEHLKPVNMIKEGLRQANHSALAKKVMIVVGTSIITGFVLHKLAFNKSDRRVDASQYNYKSAISRHLKHASFSLFQYILAIVISQNSDKIRQVANCLLTRQKKSDVSEAEVSGQHTTQTQF